MPAPFKHPVRFLPKMLKIDQKMPTLLRFLATTALLAAVGGCASWQPATLQIGETEQQVVAQLGTPTARIPDNAGYLLEYNRNPWGQATHLARFGPDGRLVSYEQVLTVEKFAQIQVNVAT